MQGKNLVYIHQYIYPGEYVPLLKEEEVKNELKSALHRNMQVPPVNVTELPDLFKIEVAIPGVGREEFFIQADNNILSVCVLHKKTGINFRSHEFNYDCFKRNITLPKNVDAEFVSAEYKAGILSLHLPKAKHTVKNQHTRIVVY